MLPLHDRAFEQRATLAAMSDVVAVALITASGTAFGTGVGAVISSGTTKRNAEVELAKVQAESKRQLDQYREEERGNRQGTYHRLLAAFDALDWWCRNPRGLGKQYESIVSEIQFLTGGCLMFGDEGVSEALRPIMDSLADIEGEPEEPSDEGQDRRRRGYREGRDELVAAQGTLTAAMRADVTSIHN